MSALLPPNVAESALSQQLLKAGLERIHQGKVRDTYALPHYPELRLVVTTDRISIFNFVLPVLIPDKGKILNAMTVFWLKEVFPDIKHHLVAAGSHIIKYLPSNLRKDLTLPERAVVVKTLNMIPVECIVRGYLTGSGWREYQEHGTLWNKKLPEGLHDGSLLPVPVFTPTNKAQQGHDLPLTKSLVSRTYGTWLEKTSLEY
jgi:phosphoribosylaminoimidazole-succinocarboxamide synthase